MRLTTYRVDNNVRLGLVAKNRIVDLNRGFTHYMGIRRAFPNDMITLLQGGEEAFKKIRELEDALLEHNLRWNRRGVFYCLNEVKVLAPIPRPRKNIVCLGVNYGGHAAERKREAPKNPIFFTKPPTSVIAPNDLIVLPKCSEEVDYEVELAFVIGREGKNISRKEAWDYIAGYTILNDVTARDLQRSHQQWFKGKSLDTFAPMGPYLVTPEEVDDPQKLRLTLSLNEELMQDGNTCEMIFKIPEIVAALSRDMTVEAGDIVSTGTPEGIGHARDPPVLLKSGDIIKAEIERIGLLENRVISQV